MFLDVSRGVIQISGSDRARFLQGLITNDVHQLKNDGDVVYTAMLSPKGRYWFDFFVVQHGEYLFIVGQNIQELFKKIRLYKLRLDVQLDILENYHVYGSFAKLVPPGTATVFKDPRHPQMPWWVISSHSEEGATDAQEYHNRRFEHTIPDLEDFEFDKSIILEWGFERLNGISFTKGCYMGQELMSRTKHLGEIRKRLMSIKFDEVVDESLVGQDVVYSNTKVGAVKSVFENNAMALLRLEHIPDSTKDVEVTVCGVPGAIKG